jgi:hypothetical protein
MRQGLTGARGAPSIEAQFNLPAGDKQESLGESKDGRAHGRARFDIPGLARDDGFDERQPRTSGEE